MLTASLRRGLKGYRSAKLSRRTAILATPSFLVFVANSLLFVAFTGGKVLLPSNTSWLMWGDSATHYLGWEFFRHGPLNVWPPGKSPLYGEGYSSSVVYSDSLPLLAIPMKFVLLPFEGQFQYFGVWLYACFIGQGFAALRFLRNLNTSIRLQPILALLFSLMPAFLYRAVTGSYGHMALVGHFLVLYALAFSLEPQQKPRLWFALLCVALLVHTYLFVMVAVFYVSGFVRTCIKYWMAPSLRSKIPSEISIFLLICGALGVLAYIAGYFHTSNASDEGFGVFRSDLFTFIDANPIDFPGWSKLVPDIGWSDGNHEGYAFLGLGVLALALLGSFRAPKVLQELSPALIPSLGLFLISLSNRILIGGRDLLELPLPRHLSGAAGVIRSSGRFVWPLMYLIVGIAAITLTKNFPRRQSLALVVAFAGLFVQAVDALPAYREVRERFEESSRNPTVLQSPGWDQLVGSRDCLRTVPVQFKGPHWVDFAELALAHNMSTNAAYLVRFDEVAISNVNNSLAVEIQSGRLDPNCLYVVVDRDPNRLAESLRQEYIQLRDHVPRSVVVLDGFVVVFRT
jgi:hypothetical protein